MKYTININQFVLAKTKLTLADAAILDWLITICNSKNAKIQAARKEGMTWICYKKLLADMPLLTISTKRSIGKSLRVIEDAGYIEMKRMSQQQMYVQTTAKVDELFLKIEGTDDICS